MCYNTECQVIKDTDCQKIIFKSKNCGYMNGCLLTCDLRYREFKDSNRRKIN